MSPAAGASGSSAAGRGGVAAGGARGTSEGTAGVGVFVGGLGGNAGSNGSGNLQGGNGGLGGTSTAAGSAGAGSQNVAGAGSLAGCGSGVFLCEDFEADAAGAFPSGPEWEANTCTSHSVDDSVAHTGSRSLRGGAEQYPACMLHADISAQNEVYARSWIRLGGASSDSGHEIGVLEFGPTHADNPELRVGIRNDDSVCNTAPGVEVTVDGVSGGERTSCSGVPLDAERWYCLQVHFARSPGRIAFSVQIDGSSVVAETEYTDALPAWSDGPLFLKLGRSSYGGNGVWPVWHDDVALSNQPIGCD
jgi:polysaccharide lyase-like protein